MGFIGVQPASVPLTADDVPDLPATKITSGTFPALNGSNLTSLTAGNLTGTLPAISGANLTGIDAGKILQIKNATSTSVTNTASTSYVHYSGIDLSITPTSSSSKIILFFTGQCDNNSSDNRQPSLSCWREIDGANNTLLSSEMQITAYSNSSRLITAASWVFVDSPSSTGSVRYRPVVRSTTGSQISLGNAQTSLVLMEATIA